MWVSPSVIVVNFWTNGKCGEGPKWPIRIECPLLISVKTIWDKIYLRTTSFRVSPNIEKRWEHFMDSGSVCKDSHWSLAVVGLKLIASLLGWLMVEFSATWYIIWRRVQKNEFILLLGITSGKLLVLLLSCKVVLPRHEYKMLFVMLCIKYNLW